MGAILETGLTHPATSPRMIITIKHAHTHTSFDMDVTGPIFFIRSVADGLTIRPTQPVAAAA